VNLLKMCQRVFSEAGISGQITSCENQTGEALRVVQWVAQSYSDILNDQGMVWRFIHKTYTKQLTAGKGAYSFEEIGVPNGVQWDTREMRVAVNADLSDETFLEHMRFPAFKDFWLFSSRRTVEGRPLNVATDNEMNLRIAPIPDQPYWLSFQAEAMAPDLVSNEDTPVFPERYHMAIVWKALREYGMFEAAPEVVSRADTNLTKALFNLSLDQTDEVVVGSPIC